MYQFIDLLKFETRPSSLLNFGMANMAFYSGGSRPKAQGGGGRALFPLALHSFLPTAFFGPKVRGHLP